MVTTLADAHRQTRDSIGSVDDSAGQLTLSTIKEKIKLTIHEQIFLSGLNDKAFVLGHATLAKLGTGLLGNTGTGGYITEWMRRLNNFDATDRLSLGTYDDGIDISNGRITIK